MPEIIFRNAPLVEIVVELRWQPGAGQMPIPLSPTGPVQPQFSLVVGSQLDAFMNRFGSEIAQHGFRRVERLIPPGIPMIPGQVVTRFKSDSDKVTVLYQVGPGVFTANATPPYRSWENFLPEVEQGLGALFSARDASESGTPFRTVSLRYIDAFNATLTQGKHPAAFLSEVLKFTLELPEVIDKYRVPEQPYKPYLTLTIPVKDGVISLNYGEALVSGKQAILFDTTYSVTANIASDKKAIVDVLHSSHGAIRDIFLELTKPIHALMQPEH